jgi:hypothetical protein
MSEPATPPVCQRSIHRHQLISFARGPPLTSRFVDPEHGAAWRTDLRVGHSGGVPTETETVPDEGSPEEPSEGSTEGSTERPRHEFRPRHLFYGLIVLGIVVMWAYVLGPWASTKAPDALDDGSVGPRAEAVCQQTAAQINALPKPFDTPDPNQRADVVARSNADYGDMLDQLAAVPWAPVTDQAASDRDHRIYNEWVDDWRTYLGNRVDYVNRLRTDRNARIFVTQKGPMQITNPIDGFARDSGMPTCSTPGDIF